jgi:hypothetical protein
LQIYSGTKELKEEVHILNKKDYKNDEHDNLKQRECPQILKDEQVHNIKVCPQCNYTIPAKKLF